MIRILLIIGVASLTWPAHLAQTRRDQPQMLAAGTAAIGGRVVTADPDALPVRRAIVQLSGGAGQRLMTVSDDEGRFRLADLPAGRFTLTASKPAFVTTYHGARNPNRGPGAPIVLAAGEQKLDLIIPLVRGGVLTGTVRDATGQPMVNARVTVMDMRPINGVIAPRPVTGGLGTATDDRGQYRIYGLPAGSFIVAAGTPLGMRLAARPTTNAEVQWARQTAGGAASSAGAAAPAREQERMAVSIYYPGTPDVDHAGRVELGAGEVREGIDITMQMVPAARIEGIILQADGRPAANAMVTVVRPGSNIILDMLGMTSRTDNEGRFVVPSLSPGPYTLFVRGASATGRRGSPARGAGGGPVRPGEVAMDLWATQDVDIDGTDLTDLQLTLQPGLAVGGHIVFDGDGPAPDPTRIRISIIPSVREGAPSLGVTAQTPDADGTFALQGVPPGAYRLNVIFPGTNQSWVARAAMSGGQDLLDGFDLRAGDDRADIVVTFTDKVTEVAGTIFDVDGRPTADYMVLVFPVDRTHWSYPSRRTRQSRPDSDGEFRIAGLPPGDYFLAALTDLDGVDLGDIEFLEALSEASIRLSLAEGEKKRQDVKLAGGGSRPRPE